MKKLKLAIRKSSVTSLSTSGKSGLDAASPAKDYTPAEAVACSLENPEACEACQ